MKRIKTTVTVLLVLLLGAAPAIAGPCFSKVIVFGDSNVDSGEESERSLYTLTGGLIPGPPNVGGRSCNGPVVVEYVADMLGAPLVNYGVGGARTGETNLVYDFIPIAAVEFTGVLSQLDAYEGSLDNKMTDPRALYIYWAGSNDLFGATEETLLPRIATALDNIETALVKLNELGARYILVATRTVRPEYSEQNNINGVIFNARLRIRVQQLDDALTSEIHLFEAFDWISDMTYNPDAYGFVETTARCSEYTDCIDDQSISDTYITWDDAHKTTRVHEIMAEALVFQALNMKGNRGRCSVRKWKGGAFSD
jgi:phospholipase/lecithinase/hemolysin